jgi:hypothetical protein
LDPSILDTSYLPVFAVVVCFVNVMFGIGLFLFYKNRKNEIISQRTLPLVLFSVFCAIVYTNYSLTMVPDFAFMYKKLPCFLDAWVIFILLPLWLYSYVLRALQVVANYRLNQAILLLQHHKLSEKDLPFLVRLLYLFRKMVRRLGWSDNLVLETTKADKSMFNVFAGKSSRAIAQANHDSESIEHLSKGKMQPEETLRVNNELNNGLQVPKLPDHHYGSFKSVELKRSGIIKEKENDAVFHAQMQQNSKRLVVGRITPRLLYYLLVLAGVFLVCMTVLVHFLYEGLEIYPTAFPTVYRRTKEPLIRRIQQGLEAPSTADNLSQALHDYRQVVGHNDIEPRTLCLRFSKCKPLYHDLLSLSLLFFVIFIFTMPYLLYVMRLTRDSLYIRYELGLYLLIQLPLFGFCTAASILLSNIDLKKDDVLAKQAWVYVHGGNMSELDDQFSQLRAQMVTVNRMLREAQVVLGVWSFIISIYVPVILAMWRSHKRKLITYSPDDFSKVLLTKEDYQIFRSFLAKQLCLENGLFFEQFSNVLLDCLPRVDTVLPFSLRELLERHYRETAQNMRNDERHLRMSRTVMMIYNDFICENSPHELNLTDEVKREIKKQLEANKCHPVVFCPAWTEVFHLMFYSTYREFYSIMNSEKESLKKKSSV